MPEYRDDLDIIIDEDQAVYLEQLEYGKFLYYADALEKEQDAWD